MAMQGSSRFVVESGDVSSKFDDDGQKKRTGICVCVYIYIYISLLLFQYIQLSIFFLSFT